MISFHLRGAVQDWPRAVKKLPKGTPFKAVNNSQLLKGAKLNNPNILTIHREWYDPDQIYDGAMLNLLQEVKHE